MADNQIALYPIADLLMALGARPGKTRNTFHSPFREDKDASLHIDPNRNVWFDHGAGVGGGNIKIVMLCRGCTAREAADYILSLPQGGGTIHYSPSGIYTSSEVRQDNDSVPLSSRVLMVREMQSPYLLEYMESRGIPTAIATRYCMEVILRGRVYGKTFEHIGFKNNSGGLALKSPSGFKSTTKGGITTINLLGEFTETPMSDTVTIFEGFFDFLSWLASKGVEIPPTDVIVLNSVTNVPRVIPLLKLHGRVICLLDHDAAGRNAFEQIKSIRMEYRNPTIIDGSLFYYAYNDVNEWWMATNHLKEV